MPPFPPHVGHLERLRPGFGENHGRCCGTAGVGETLLDAAQDAGGPRTGRARCSRPPAGWGTCSSSGRSGDDAGRVLAVRRAPSGSAAAPTRGPSWMQGAAGIAAYLLRLARVAGDGPDAAPVIDRPDSWWAVPDRLRTG